MGKKRKRPVKAKQAPREPPSQRQSTKSTSRHLSPASNAAEISHPVISQYYRQVVTLREYLLQRIPHSSKSRRRRIAGVRSDNAGNASPSTAPSANETDLAHLLDTTLVGVWAELSPPRSQARRRDFIAYTQTRAETQTGTDTGPASPQAEIVDFVISSLFTRGGHLYQRTQHLLSHGFQRASDFHSKLLPCSIMGIEARFPNKNAQILKQAPWTDVLALLGGNGEEIMLGLLLDCGIFAAVDVKRGVYYQLSGAPTIL
ncbi:telomerase reverse transcriptase [Aspergillus lucknowensis]|uniref:Telomerase reverse transcriptase n=1 Tax=Aspergillus lucknowensis TaxID=176173 RepID=A0ABR4L875_9EURO